MAEARQRFAYFLTATTALVAIAAAAPPASAQSNPPIKIGVIAEVQSIAGAATPGGAQIAADEINAQGGVNGRKIEIVSYDNKSSSADSVRAFQRAVSDDKVSAVIASYISEVVLALEPWAARLHMPLITPGAASNEITRPVHDDYDKNKYTFHGYLTSGAQAQAVCDAAKDLLVDVAGSTDPDKMVTELEKTDYVGTIGRVQFYGRDNQFTHGLKYGPDHVSGMIFQWQGGKQVPVWPAKVADGKLKYPAFARPSN